MSKPIERVQIITGIQRRRVYTADEKVRLDGLGSLVRDLGAIAPAALRAAA